MRWSAPTDNLTAAGLGLRKQGALGRSVTVQNLVTRDGTLTFTVPPGASVPTGEQIELTFLGTSLVVPATGTCPVSRCSVSVDFRVPPLPVKMGH